MMVGDTVNSWLEFEDKIAEIKEKYPKPVTPILYRGQSDSAWQLKTTLERFSRSAWTVEEYVKLALRCAPEIESFTGRRWDLIDTGEIQAEIKKYGEDAIAYIPQLDFLIYLRHHGFPSPLLDWTFSPYVAVFFALSEESKAENATVFAYVKAPIGVEGGVVGAPRIKPVGRGVRTHKRHFLQQATYTICTEVKGELDQGNPHVFVCHERVLEKKSKRQDILMKINISRTKRIDFLSRLNESNINEFSVPFGEKTPRL